MKTKVFFLFCLFLGIGLTQLSAQNGKDGTGTIKYDFSFANWYGPVFCEGVIVDFIYCPILEGKVYEHYRHGELIRGINQVKDLIVTSVNTNEVFKLEAGFDHWNLTKGYDNFHGNLIGNKGNNISFNIKFDLSNGQIVEIHSNCH
jgi:hypothetical protein